MLCSRVVFLVPVLASLSGHPPLTGTLACEVSAVLAESATWAQYLFAIAVAAVSYFILLHPLSKITLALERYWYVIVTLLCSIAASVAGLQAAFYRGIYVGGFCWNVNTHHLPFLASVWNMRLTICYLLGKHGRHIQRSAQFHPKGCCISFDIGHLWEDTLVSPNADSNFVSCKKCCYSSS